MHSLRRWLRFNRAYFGQPPWDTGVSPPELLDFIASHPPGRALDLGCGSGTNVLTLAGHGWDAVGVDYALTAIILARRKARARGLTARFMVGDVAKLSGLGPGFDLVLDIGCFHHLADAAKTAYARQMARVVAPGGTFLLYGHQHQPGGRRGIVDEDLAKFGPQLVLRRRVDGRDDYRDQPATWLTFEWV